MMCSVLIFTGSLLSHHRHEKDFSLENQCRVLFWNDRIDAIGFDFTFIISVKLSYCLSLFWDSIQTRKEKKTDFLRWVVESSSCFEQMKDRKKTFWRRSETSLSLIGSVFSGCVFFSLDVPKTWHERPELFQNFIFQWSVLPFLCSGCNRNAKNICSGEDSPEK